MNQLVTHLGVQEILFIAKAMLFLYFVILPLKENWVIRVSTKQLRSLNFNGISNIKLEIDHVYIYIEK